MAPSATATQSVSSKIKRPAPPGIQTNGINSSKSSPSPSMSAGRLPPAASYTQNSAVSNGSASAVSGPRSANRTRRDPPSQLLGRGQRHTSVGLKSAGLGGDSSAMQLSQPTPYVKTDEYILRKYKGCKPSLIIHLHPTHFRFDQQEGSFTYKSPMKTVIEHLRTRTIPHDLVEFMDVDYYEECMIVQVHDHKSVAPSPESNRVSNTGAGKTTPFSVHNYNTFLTPSPFRPYPTQSPSPDETNERQKEEDKDLKSSTEQKDKENMPAPAVPGDGQRSKTQAREAKIITVVLHPTALTKHIDFAVKTVDTLARGEGRKDSKADGTMTIPPTPSTAVPSTPLTGMAPPPKRLKKGKNDVHSSTIYGADSTLKYQTAPVLMLDPVSNARESAALLKALEHPMHTEKPPSPKSRKRTVAEMAADVALAAEQERFMLTMDERLSSNIAGAPGGNPADGDGQVGGASFEPRFERFKTLENIRANHEEKARVERQRKEEADRKAAIDRERDKLRMEAEKREQEKNRNSAQQLQQQQQAQAQAQAQARTQAEATNRRAAAMAQQQIQNMQGMPNQAQSQHAHPQANGMMPNGMQGQPQRFQQQQVSQAQASSPIVRNGTPQNHSSPMNGVGNVPMQTSNSSLGGSPARPGSVVQNHPPMNAPTPHGMTAQRSQQSHAGTPRMPNSTPNIQNTPLSRQISQTPRMSLASPLQGQVAQVPQQMMINGQAMQLTPQQQAHIQQQQQQRMAAAGIHPGNQGMNGMMGGQQINAQYLQAQMMHQQQQRQQAQQAQGMNGVNPMAQNYAMRMAQMTAAQQAGQPGMNQNFMNGNAAMQQQMMQQQQMQRMQQQQQQQAQLRAQQQHQAQGQVNQQNVFTQQVMRVSQMIYQKEHPAFEARYAPNPVPDDIERQFRNHCQTQAQAQVQASMRARQQMRQQQAQQMMAAQQGMPQGMNGMQNGMGM